MTPRPSPFANHAAPCAYATAPASEIQYVIGVDGGGSRTRALLYDRDGQVLGQGESGPSGLGQGIDQALANTSLSITAAFEAAGLALPPGYLCAVGLGLAGAGIPGRSEEFLRRAHMYGQLRLESDAYAALVGAHRGAPGAIVIAGTGSVALARRADGTRHTIGGWGFPAGDEGAGAWLGLQALRLAQHALDGRQTTGPLARAVGSALGDSRSALLAWAASANPASYAQLAPLVFEHAAQDPRAAELLRGAATALHALVQAIDPPARLPLCILGSIGQRLEALLPDATRARCVPPAEDATTGAARLMREHLDLPPT